MGRPVWKGSINFGLVNIAVQLETAVREKTVRFHMLTKDGTCRLRQKLYCPDTKKEYDFGQTARGIEVAPGQYALVEKEEIARIKPQRGHAIEIEQFVALEEIDPIYFDAVYFVTPAGDSVKAYKLFHDAIREQQRIGLARFVMHDRQHLVALRAASRGLVLHTMHYADEVLSLDDALPASLAHATASAAEVKIARQLIDQMTEPADLKRFKDDYREQMESLIDQKKRGKKTVVISDDEDAENIPHTINLMEALKRSLETGKSRETAHPRKKSA
jgi:DNA end-binding protein Ku